MNERTVVYFAQADYGGPIKIGYTHDRVSRLATIAKDLPFDLIEIGHAPGYRFRERFVQCWFRDNCIKGEWFQPTPELLRWALEARTTGDLHLAPSELPNGYSADTSAIRFHLSRHKIGLDEVARHAGSKLAAVQLAMAKPRIGSRLLLAAIMVAFGKHGAIVDLNDGPLSACGRRGGADDVSWRLQTEAA
jgi:hypothetical protein